MTASANNLDDARTKAERQERAKAMGKGIVTVFGAFLDSLTGTDSSGVPESTSKEWRELVAQLQSTQLLSIEVLPENLRVALGHIDGSDPLGSIGYIREAFVRASTFVGSEG